MQTSALNQAQVADPLPKLVSSVKTALLNTRQAAEHIGIKETTAEIWRCYGKGPRYLKIGRLVRYRLSDLDAWLDQQARSSTSQQIEG